MFQLYNKKARQQESLGGLVSLVLCPWIQEVPCQLLTTFSNSFVTGKYLGHPEPCEFNIRCQSVSFLLNTTSLSQTIDQRVKGNFKCRYTWYSMEMIVNAVEENPDRTSWSLDRLHDWRCDCCYQKNPMKVPNNKFLLKKTVQVLCMPSQDLWHCQLRKSWKRLWI